MPDEGEGVPAQTVRGRFQHREAGGRGDGGIHGVAAAAQDVQPRLGGQGLGGADHAARAVYHPPLRGKAAGQGVEGYRHIYTSNGNSDTISRPGGPCQAPAPRAARALASAAARFVTAATAQPVFFEFSSTHFYSSGP